MIFGPLRENATVRKTALFAILCLALSAVAFAAPPASTPAPAMTPPPATTPAPGKTTTTKKHTHKKHHHKKPAVTQTPTPSR